MDDYGRYDRPIRIAEGIYWVGFYEQITNFHCNPYIVIEGDKAVLIDGGSRPDFANVMMKILQTGINPKQISALIYQHSDPDLCGSLPNMIDICGNPDLRVLSEASNNIFITYYIEREKHYMLEPIDKYGYSYTFNGRTLQFFKTPFCHSAGSFVTYDQKTKTIFSSDLFGSFSKEWDLFIQLDDECVACIDFDNCVKKRPYCPLSDIVDFHKKIMPSGKALKYAMDVIGHLDADIVAPQHGSVFTSKRDINVLARKLSLLTQVGIDLIC